MEKKRLDFHYINFSEELVLEIERGEKKEMYKGSNRVLKVISD